MLDRNLWIIYYTRYQDTDKQIYHYLSVPDAIEIMQKYKQPTLSLSDEEALTAFLIEHDGRLVHPVVTHMSPQPKNMIEIAVYQSMTRHQEVLILTDYQRSVSRIISHLLQRIGEKLSSFHSPNRITPVNIHGGGITIVAVKEDGNEGLSNHIYDMILFDKEGVDDGKGSDSGRN